MIKRLPKGCAYSMRGFANHLTLLFKTNSDLNFETGI